MSLPCFNPWPKDNVEGWKHRSVSMSIQRYVPGLPKPAAWNLWEKRSIQVSPSFAACTHHVLLSCNTATFPLQNLHTFKWSNSRWIAKTPFTKMLKWNRLLNIYKRIQSIHISLFIWLFHLPLTNKDAGVAGGVALVTSALWEITALSFFRALNSDERWAWLLGEDQPSSTVWQTVITFTPPFLHL